MGFSLNQNGINKSIAIALIILQTTTVFGQQYVTFKHLGVNDGLNDLTVNSFAQDSLGVLYIGTENGLNVFDGTSIESYYASDSSNTISANIINNVFVDSKNRAWIGNSEGIDLYIRKDNSFKSFRVKQTEFSFKSFIEDKNGRIWIGSYGAGLHYYDEETGKLVANNIDSIPSISISCFAEDLWGNIWFGTETNGLFFLNTDTKEISQIVKSNDQLFKLKKARIRALCTDKHGNILIGTYDDGVYIYTVENEEINRFAPKNAKLHYNSYISQIIKDAKGDFWIGTDGNGIFKYMPKTNQIVEITENNDYRGAISSKSIRALFFDKDETLWVGTFRGGVNYSYEMRKKDFKHIHQKFEHKSITCFLNYKKGSILVGTDGGGLYIYNLKSQQVYKPNINNKLPIQNILSLAADYNGNIWLGTYEKGLFKLDKDLKFLKKIVKENSAILNNDIRAIEINESNLYFTTHGGGFVSTDLNLDSITNYQMFPQDTSRTIVFDFLDPLLLDNRGLLWIGSRAGLSIINSQTGNLVNIAGYNNASNLSSYSIKCFYNDSQGNLWLGNNSGLSLLKISDWKINKAEDIVKLKTSEFIFENYLDDKYDNLVVNSILEDNEGNLWLGTNIGLAIFNIKTLTAKFLYAEAGINMHGFNPKSALKLNDGSMLLGGNNGFIHFKPDQILNEPIQPSLLLSNFYLNMKKVYNGDKFDDRVVLTQHCNYTNSITLTHRAKIISIQYGSTNTFLQDKIEYAYKLENFDDDWHYSNSRSKLATYTNLQPGNYNFKFKAKYTNDNWNDTTRELQLIILKPFWKTLGFKLGLVLINLIITLVVYRILVKNLKRRNKKLEILIAEKSKILAHEREAKLVIQNENKSLIIERQNAEKEKLATELALKTQEDSMTKAKLSSSLIQIGKKNDILLLIKRELTAILDTNVEEIKDKLNKVVQKINSEQFFKDDWQQFEKHFNSAYDGFIYRLKSKHPSLTRKDLRLCSYLKMNLSSNEIAQISNITVRGVEKSRSRLRKKLELDSSDNLTNYILNF